MDSFLKGSTDSHNFSDRLHRTAQSGADSVELLKIPSRDLDDTVVERRLETGRSELGHRVSNLVQGDVETKLGSDKGQGVPSGLGSESGRSRETSVDLDDAVLFGEWVESILDVTLSNDTEMTDDIDSSRSEHVVVGIREGLRRGNDDGVSGMNTERIKVLLISQSRAGFWTTHLHVTDRDTVVSAISNNLVLDLLPSLHTLLNQNLGRNGESLATEVAELLLVFGETGSQTTESKGSSDNDREPNLGGSLQGLLKVGGRSRFGALFANLLHGSSEHFSIFGGDDGFDGSTENLDAELGKLILELDTDTQGGLTTESTVDTVRFLVLDDLEHKVWSDGQEVDLVGQTLGRLDGGNVWIDQDGIDTFLLESLDSLRSRIVEFSGLTNRKTTGSENKNLFGILSRSSSNVGRELSARNVDGDESTFSSRVDHALNEDIEQELGVSRSGCGLWVELDREVRLAVLAGPDTLVTVVIGVGEQGLPTILEGGDVDLVTMVLRGDVTSTGSGTSAGQVHTTVSVLHFSGRSARGKGEQLVTETDTKDRSLADFQSFAEVGDGFFDHGWVTWTVGNKETVVRLGLGVEVVVLTVKKFEESMTSQHSPRGRP